MSDPNEQVSTMALAPQKAATNMTVREVIGRLALVEDMDAEVCFSFHNSDPIPVTDIQDTGDGQVVVS